MPKFVLMNVDVYAILTGCRCMSLCIYGWVDDCNALAVAGSVVLTVVYDATGLLIYSMSTSMLILLYWLPVCLFKSVFLYVSVLLLLYVSLSDFEFDKCDSIVI